MDGHNIRPDDINVPKMDEDEEAEYWFALADHDGDGKLAIA